MDRYGFRGDKDIRNWQYSGMGFFDSRGLTRPVDFLSKQKLRINSVYHTTYLSEVRIIFQQPDSTKGPHSGFKKEEFE